MTELGSQVIAAASTDGKVQFALELGADSGLAYPVEMDKTTRVNSPTS